MCRTLFRSLHTRYYTFRYCSCILVCTPIIIIYPVLRMRAHLAHDHVHFCFVFPVSILSTIHLFHYFSCVRQCSVQCLLLTFRRSGARCPRCLVNAAIQSLLVPSHRCAVEISSKKGAQLCCDTVPPCTEPSLRCRNLVKERRSVLLRYGVLYLRTDISQCRKHSPELMSVGCMKQLITKP